MENFILENMTSGELFTYEYLKTKESDTFKVIPNVLLKKEDGGSNQIDFLILNLKGLFVIEYKDFNGWIHGNENSKMWTQTFSNGSKYRFRNPIKQNDNHIKTIKRLFQLYNISIPVYNIVVFSNTAKLANISGTGIINFCDFQYEIDKYPNIIYGDFQYDYIYKTIDNERLKNPQDYIKHIEYAKSFNEEHDEASKKNNKKLKLFKKNKKHMRISLYNRVKLVILLLILIYLSSKIFIPVIFHKDTQEITNIQGSLETDTQNGNNLDASYDGVNVDEANVQENKVITIGTLRSDVIDILGVPDRIDLTSVEILVYKDSWIAINDDLVIAWQNYFDQLSDYLPQKVDYAEPIFIGSTKEQVLNSLGAPTLIKHDNSNIYYYRESYIIFDFENLVTGYENIINQISDGLIKKKVNVSIIEIGSSKIEVLARMGPPSAIRVEEPNKYYYKNSYFLFNENDRLIEYENVINQLKYDLQIPNSEAHRVGIGSTKDDVIKVLGAPTSIKFQAPDKFVYGSSYMLFDEEGYLIEYENKLGELKYGLKDSNINAPRIDIGASKEEVITVLGGPTIIKDSEPNKFYYKNSYMIFNDGGYLIGYNNILDQLKYGLYAENIEAPKIGIGSTKLDVLNILGGATSINASEPNKYYYKNSYIMFDENDIVLEILNKYEQLTNYLNAN